MMIEKRHTVRKYLDKPLDVDLISLLNARIEQNNELYDLTLKLVMNNSDGISSLARLMSNNTVQNYIILAGKECSSLDEKIGYCGADLILYAQSLGLNTWWCGGMFNGKNALKHLYDKDVRVNGVIRDWIWKNTGCTAQIKDS
ncbi:MAG: nitroreductase family protein [Holdemanella porci]